MIEQYHINVMLLTFTWLYECVPKRTELLLMLSTLVITVGHQ